METRRGMTRKRQKSGRRKRQRKGWSVREGEVDELEERWRRGEVWRRGGGKG